MKLHQCDHCGVQAALEVKWIVFTDEATDSRTYLNFVIGGSHEVCSWACLRDYAVLKLTEAEVSA